MGSIVTEIEQASEITPEDAIRLMRQLDQWASGAPIRKRAKDRFPIACVLRLTPVDNNGSELETESLDVIGKDLSTNGIAFSHMEPLRHQRAVISFSHPKAGHLAVELEVIWSRPTPIGLYESGCRLIRKLPNCVVHCKE